jgi:hypothetical protein
MVKVAKSSREGYRHPRVGEKRQSRQPLRIDKLPAEVKSAIIAARAEGKTWKETAQAASAVAGMNLPTSMVQRWYDLRIEQPQNDASVIASLLREIIDLLKSRLPAVRA